MDNATINNIDFDKHTFDVVGKGNKHRTVYISDKALYHVKIYLESRTDRNKALFVSNNKLSKKLEVSGIEAILSRVGEKAGVDNVHPHRCRSTFATRLVDVGMSIHQVSKLLGHESVDTTMIYYRGNYNLENDYNKYVNNI